MKRVAWLLGWIGLLGLIDGASANDAAEADRAAVLATTQAWIAAFNTRDAERIAALYAPDAVFWGTVSKTIRTTPEAVVEYFRDSAKRRPKLRMELVESHVHQSPISSKSHIGRDCPAMKAMTLPTSSPEPPPNAITPS